MDCVYETYEGKDLSQLKRVTLVIPTYNRNYYLSRCLWYHAHFPFAEIIVADSSDENKREVNRQTISDIQQMFPTKVTYLEYNFPAEKYGGEIYRKWGDAVMHVNTEYSLSCTDKEFLIPTTVAKSVVFLDEHPDYSIADGSYYMIEAKNVIHRWQGNNSITSDSVNERLLDVLKENTPYGTQFALHRTTNIRKAFNNIYTYNLHDIRFGECEIESLPIILGKINRDLQYHMSYRDVIHLNKQMILGHTTKKKITESSYQRYATLEEYPDTHLSYLLLKLEECLYNTDYRLDKDTLKNYVSSVINSRYYKNNSMKSPILNKSKILRYIWAYFTPYFLKHKLSHMIGSGIVEPPLNKRGRNPELAVVFKLIFDTQKYYKTDSVIPILEENKLL